MKRQDWAGVKDGCINGWMGGPWSSGWLRAESKDGRSLGLWLSRSLYRQTGNEEERRVIKTMAGRATDPRAACCVLQTVPFLGL